MKRLWLKEAREKSQLTMKQLAEKLDISEGYYCEIENGNRQKSMDISVAIKLSDILNMPIIEILNAEESIRSA